MRKIGTGQRENVEENQRDGQANSDASPTLENASRSNAEEIATDRVTLLAHNLWRAACLLGVAAISGLNQGESAPVLTMGTPIGTTAHKYRGSEAPAVSPTHARESSFIHLHTLTSHFCSPDPHIRTKSNVFYTRIRRYVYKTRFLNQMWRRKREQS